MFCAISLRPSIINYYTLFRLSLKLLLLLSIKCVCDFVIVGFSCAKYLKTDGTTFTILLICLIPFPFKYKNNAKYSLLKLCTPSLYLLAHPLHLYLSFPLNNPLLTYSLLKHLGHISTIMQSPFLY